MGSGSLVTISASYRDSSPSSGINSSSAAVKLDGAALTGCTTSASGVSCPAANLASGGHPVTVQASDLAGNTAVASGSFNVSRNYFWAWYDNASSGTTDWVMVVNPSSTASLYYEVRIPGQQVASGTLQLGANAAPTFPGVAGGPVEVQAWTDSSKLAAAKVLASQRVLWNGYFNEVVGQ